MARVRGLFKGIAPESDLEVAVQRDPDALQGVHVEARYAPLDPPDDLALDPGQFRKMLLRPVPPEARSAHLSPELRTLLAGPSIGFGGQAGAPSPTHGRLQFGMVAE
ncbi:MAG TPA: hypothetical protein VFU17_08630 [Candidatus Limnocylindrales bacterium]|nr:hypothetical protein [Candidatus Limnocylindrales bacterium]